MVSVMSPAPESRSPATVEPLRIGPIELSSPVVLAPMAGITNTAFRRLCREYGAGLYVTEMV
ncbi:MAG: tRNA-dihydrouridine synthase, partial [Brevibacterium sp.]|nr:tRNA-dihydrouridine synthase [Brevibacterium sp.]